MNHELLEERVAFSVVLVFSVRVTVSALAALNSASVIYPWVYISYSTWLRRLMSSSGFVAGLYFVGFFVMEASVAHSARVRSSTCLPKYSMEPASIPWMMPVSGIVFRYASRMVSLLYLLSRPSARKISRTLRMLSCSLSPVRFLMSCCSSVDAPRFVPQMRLPVKAFSAAPMVPLRLMPGSVRKFLSSMAMTAFCRFSGMAESSRQIRFSLRESEAYSLPLMS